MRSLLIASAFCALFSAHAFAATELDCNLGFGPVAQVVVKSDTQGFLLDYLTETGRWFRGLPLKETGKVLSQFEFEHKGERIKMVLRGTEWSYYVSYTDSDINSVIGMADCR